jgi:PAS domain S-box-containing protein
MQPLLSEILDHPTDLLALASPTDLKLISCNKNLEYHFKMESGSLVGKSIYALFNKKVPREKMASLLSQLGKTHFFIDRDSIPGHHLFFNLVNCEDGLCCVIRVSSQKQNTAVEQYQQLFEKNLAGVYKADINGVLLSCNKAFATILGYENPEDLIGRNTSGFYVEVELRTKYLNQLKEKPILMNFELKLIRKDGSIAYCLENSYLENIPDGKDLISGTLIDITHMKEMETALQESEQRFKTISAVTNEGVVFIENNVINDCNDQFAKLLGYPASVDVVGRELKEFITPADIHRIRTGVEISPANRSEIRTTNRLGKTIFLEVTGSYMPYRGSTVLALVADDITTRKKVELALQQSLVSFRRLLENSPNGVVIITEGKIRYLNLAACELLGVEDEDELYGENFLPFIADDFRKEIKADIDDIRDGLEIDYKEIKLQKKSGESIDVGIKSTLTAYENKPSIQVTLNNVTAKNQLIQEQIRVRFIEEINAALKAEIKEHKTTQRKLEQQQRKTTEQKAKLESIFNSTENLMMWTVNQEYLITGMNKNFVSWMDKFYSQKVNIGDNIMTVLQKYLDRDFYQGQLQAFTNGFKGRPQQFEFALRNSDDHTIWLQAFLNPVYMDGKLEELSCLLYDNTERREIDKKVRDSLKEKEILLQEVHHRVKNNLQVISSILNLQSSYVEDETTLEVLRESQQRIKSMSFIHETIYRTADFSKLEFTDYIKTIANNLIQSYHTRDVAVEFVSDMDLVYLNLDQSIPCGLILNELVSNALKYAFKGRKKGRLEIQLHETNGEITLLVKDDGVGLSENFNYEKTNSLGIQLVYTLIEQLDGTIDVTNKNGAAFLIKFHRN